jgi:hypothetical protein
VTATCCSGGVRDACGFERSCAVAEEECTSTVATRSFHDSCTRCVGGAHTTTVVMRNRWLMSTSSIEVSIYMRLGIARDGWKDRLVGGSVILSVDCATQAECLQVHDAPHNFMVLVRVR